MPIYATQSLRTCAGCGDAAGQNHKCSQRPFPSRPASAYSAGSAGSHCTGCGHVVGKLHKCSRRPTTTQSQSPANPSTSSTSYNLTYKKCNQCGESYPENDLPHHKLKCEKNMQTGPFCVECHAVADKNHKCVQPTFPKSQSPASSSTSGTSYSDLYRNCLHCGKMYSKTGSSKHESVCKKAMKTGPICVECGLVADNNHNCSGGPSFGKSQSPAGSTTSSTSYTQNASEMKYHCQNHGDGCDQRLKSEEFANHLRDCPYRRVRHRLCNTMLQAKDLVEHKKTCRPQTSQIPHPSGKVKKIALIIGISDSIYGHLRNPVNDAVKITAVLEKMNFKCTILKDRTIKEYQKELKEYLASIDGSTLSFVHFSGHGGHKGTSNYLCMKDGTVDACELGKQVSEKKPLASVFTLDCCRTPSRGSSNNVNIMTMEFSDTIVAFACGAGDKASDGRRGNGAFSELLIENLSQISPLNEILVKMARQFRDRNEYRQRITIVDSTSAEIRLHVSQDDRSRSCEKTVVFLEEGEHKSF